MDYLKHQIYCYLQSTSNIPGHQNCSICHFKIEKSDKVTLRRRARRALKKLLNKEF